jgi:TPR repeat protein
MALGVCLAIAGCARQDEPSASAQSATVEAYGDGSCQLEELKGTPANDPECYFYNGTAAFRAEDYKRAALFWKSLIGLESVPVEAEHLKVSAYNNLGFLYFYGHGVETNKKAAIEYWSHAMRSGNEESAYHLCHAFAEKKEPTYNPKVALGYCREGLRRYGLLKERDGQLDEIVRQLLAYVRTLEQ